MKIHAVVFLVLGAMSAAPSHSRAQTRPSQAETQAAMTDPAIRARILAQVRTSGMSPAEVRTRLRSMGYTDDVIDRLVGVSADSTITDDVFAALRDLKIMDSTVVDSLRQPYLQRRRVRDRSDSLLLDSLSFALKNDTLRAAILRLLSSPGARKIGFDSGYVLFGLEVFDRQTTQFDPSVSGPLPPDYRIGPGDKFTLVLTGDLERTEEFTVTKDGWVFLRDAGQVPAANLTFEQLRASIGGRLGRVYSSISTGALRYSVLPTTVGTNQVFVLGDVKSPNAYSISRLGTVLTALYAAGGPSETGDSRSVDVTRNNRVVATMDLYEYLLNGSSRGDLRLENGDVVFVRPQGPRVRVAGAVVRPATYELKAGESLADAIRMAGGFRPEAERRRVLIERYVPAAQRAISGSDKELLDITSSLLATGFGPTTQKMEAGDVVHVFRVAPVVVNKVEVHGNVFHPASTVALTPGMRLSEAIAKAGGIKPDTYLGAVQISRLMPDSSRRLLRVALRPDGRPEDDIQLVSYDIIRTYSQTEFRTERHVTVGGAVRKPSIIPYQEGMTMRDAILLAGGLQESALLTEAEIGRLPTSRTGGVTASTMRVALDSTYLFERTADGRYAGPPGVPAPAAVAPEVLLQPYDAVSVLHQPDFEYQRTVSVIGRVKYPGSYTLKTKTERLSELIARAGGLSNDADSAAITFIRQRDSIGRVGVDLPRVLKNIRHVDNLILVDRDSIFIPAYNSIVLVKGEVNSPAAAVAYVRGADIDYYVRSAGGETPTGDAKKAYVLQPSGKVETKHRTALMYVSSPRPLPGSTVTVPVKDLTNRVNWVSAAQTSLSLLASLITVAVLIKQ